MSVLAFDTSAVVEFLVGGAALAERVRDHIRGRRLAAPHVVTVDAERAGTPHIRCRVNDLRLG
ncbi:hypothetical protein ACPCTK_11475 [Streptomyces pseudogriseolus]|uniref:hypothetical protein n=1 Tax=Streptomyces pseudogriseolus TaxID=36817 RepID=UPI003FA221CA